ncbi:MAG: Brp/Blh family beta-carotene 15,15'-monooxygenase [Halopseudomonas sp.]|jgi:Brp/Blh family beta-carotene 15,15'-monooxygenase
MHNVADNRNRLEKCSGGRRHQLLVLIIASLSLVASLALPVLTIEQQFWIVLIPIGIFGLSHGGADPMILKTLTTTTSVGVIAVMCAYVLASLMFITLIWALPIVALLAFLSLSVWHFGYTDEAFLSPTKTPLLRWLAGSMPILGPMLGHPHQTGELFAWLIKLDAAQVVGMLVWLGPALAVLWVLAFGCLLFSNSKRPDLRVFAELLLVGAALIALPPLLSFALYFCVIHSVRHFLSIAEHRLLAHQKRPSLTLFPARKILPATLIAIAMAGIAWIAIVFLEPASNMLIEAVRVMFWALAALTLPHTIIVRLWWNRESNRIL